MRYHEIIGEAESSKQDKAALEAEVETLRDALEARYRR
jgi:hypothetical protein